MRNLKYTLACVLFGLMMGCSGIDSSSLSPGVVLNSEPNKYPSATYNLRLSLTDAPARELRSVFVNVDHAELFVRNVSGNGRIILAQDLGLVDLMRLRNGVLLPLRDLNLAIGTEITGIRLILKGEDNHSIKNDGTRCEMQTPSGQRSGIKIHLSAPFIIEIGHVYSMVMDFDAEKSVVIKGNGECLLKPVLKLLQVTRRPVLPPSDEVATPTPAPPSSNDDDSVSTMPVDEPADEPVTGGTDDNSEDSGFEPQPVDDEPPIIENF